MPPGPIPLPCIGNLHLISNKPMHIVFTNLSEKYGTVFSISLGMERYVIINDIENATKTLSLKSFSGRPYNSHYLYMYSRGFTNVINADYSDDWNRRRKLAQNALRMISDENGDIESKLIRESQELHRRLRSKIGSLVSVRTELGKLLVLIIVHTEC